MWSKVRQSIETKGYLAFTVDLLTNETVKMATLQYRVAAIIKSAPFELEGKSAFRVKMFKSKWKLAIWHVANWIVSLQTAFLLLSLFWSMGKGTSSGKLVMHLICTVEAICGWVFMTSLYLKPKECLFMLNQHDLIVRAAEEAKVKVPHWASHYFVIMTVYYFAFALFGFWIIFAAMFLYVPTSAYYIYAYLPLAWQQNYAVLAAALFYEMIWTSWYLTALSTFFCYWCADVFTMNDILASLTAKRLTTKAHGKLYLYLQLFCVVFNYFNGSFFTVGFTTIVVTCPIVFIYLALTATDLNILMYLILPTLSFFSVFLIMFFLPQHSKVGILSTDCVKVLRSRTIQPQLGNSDRLDGVMTDAFRRVVMKKRIRAFAPLGIRIWFFGIYTLQTSQELIDQLFNNILLLLSL